MGKRYMTLADLYNFYLSQDKSQKFSCQDNGDTIVVRTEGKLIFSKDDAKDGLYPTRVQMNFVGDNLNNSRIEMKSQKNALPSSHYRPLLAYIHDVDGEPQFYGHNMEIDENGETVYIEQPVGVIAEEAHIEHDDNYDKDYAVALGYIWEEYNKAAYILERDGKCDVSVELSIRSLSYNTEDKILVLDDFYYSGCTILGVDNDGNKVNPAMPGSNITLADFSISNKPIKYENNDKLIETLEKLNATLESFDINIISTKGGDNQVNKFEMLLEKYNKTVEDITFEYEGLSEDALETAFAEAFAEPKKKKVEDDDTQATTDDDDDDSTQDPEQTPNDEPSLQSDDEPEVNDESELQSDDEPISEGGESSETEIFSAQLILGTKTFAVSLSDIMYALSELVNDTYADEGSYYSVDVYADDSYVIMMDWMTGKAYKQNYKCKKKHSYSLVGDRVPVKAIYVTEDEEKELDKIRSNYSSIEEKLAKYEAEPEKIQILESADYITIADKAEFAELKKQENHFDLSIDELKAKADEIILSYAKAGQLTFSSNVEETEKKVIGRKQFADTKKSTKVKSRYGNLLKNI